MISHKRTWFINFNGIGNGIIVAPILKCIEESIPDMKYYHTENSILSDKWFIKHAKLRNLVGFSPIKWRRFDKAYWKDIIEFLDKNKINLIVNFRNQGPKYDKKYFTLKKLLTKRGIEFWDLDFKIIEKREKQKNFAKDIMSMLIEHRISMKVYNSQWLPGKIKRKSIGFGIMASQKNKKWPQEKWIALGKMILSKRKERIVLFAGTTLEDIETARRIRTAIGNKKCKIVFNSSLSDVGKYLGKLKLFISNDTGLLHMACAAKTPTIGLYTATDPKIWSPYTKTKFIAYANKFMKKCPLNRVHAGNCSHYYNSCPIIAKYGDGISQNKVFDSIKKII